MDELINVDSLWLYDKRDNSGKHSNVYHGNFTPQIPNNLIRRYTTNRDVVLDIFMGSGTTLFECEALDRDFIGFDINQEIINYVESKMDQSSPIKYVINNCDSTSSLNFAEAMNLSLKRVGKDQIDFFIAHPPYMDIVKFTEHDSDLSQISDIDLFVEKVMLAVENLVLPIHATRKSAS